MYITLFLSDFQANETFALLENITRTVQQLTTKASELINTMHSYQVNMRNLKKNIQYLERAEFPDYVFMSVTVRVRVRVNPYPNPF